MWDWTLTPHIISQSDVSASKNPGLPPIPAFEQNISIPPANSFAFSITLITSFSFETSAPTANPWTLFAVSSAPLKFISTHIIESAPEAWNSSQSALPIPLAAPVTTTLLLLIFTTPPFEF